MNNKYITTIKAAKLAARDLLRSRWIMNLLAEKRPLNANITAIAERVTELKKDLADADFTLRIATEQENPRLDEITKDYTDTAKYIADKLETLDKNRIATEEALAKIDAKIEDVSNGVLKVSFDNMNNTAKELLTDKFGADFVNGFYDKEVDVKE